MLTDFGHWQELKNFEPAREVQIRFFFFGRSGMTWLGGQNQQAVMQGLCGGSADAVGNVDPYPAIARVRLTAQGGGAAKAQAMPSSAAYIAAPLWLLTPRSRNWMLVAGPVAHVFSRGIALFAEFWCHEITGVAIREVFVCFFVPPNGVGGECEREALNGHFFMAGRFSEWF